MLQERSCDHQPKRRPHLYSSFRRVLWAKSAVFWNCDIIILMFVRKDTESKCEEQAAYRRMRGACVTLAELENGGVDGAVLPTESTHLLQKSMLQIILNWKQHLLQTSYTTAAHYIAAFVSQRWVLICVRHLDSRRQTIWEHSSTSTGEGEEKTGYNEVHCELRSACSTVKLEKKTQDKSSTPERGGYANVPTQHFPPCSCIWWETNNEDTGFDLKKRNTLNLIKQNNK